MRRALDYAKRNKPLLIVTALLMAGAGCVGAVKQTTDQLTQDALKPISVPVEVYKLGIDAASNANAVQAEKNREIEEIQ